MHKFRNAASVSLPHLKKKSAPVQHVKKAKFENYLHTVLNSTREAILLLDKSGNIKVFNDYAKKIILEFTGSDITFISNLIDAVPDWRKKDVKNNLGKTAKGEAYEYEVSYPDGKWLQVSFFPVFNNEGRILEICGTLKDITARKNVEEQVRKSEEMYRSLIDSMMEGVVFQSIDGKSNAANKSASVILGLSKETLTAHGLLFPGLAWVNREERPVNFEKIFLLPLKKFRSVSNTVLGLKKSDRITWLSINGEPVKMDNGRGIQGCIFTFTDITETINNRDELNLLSKVIKETSNIVVITDKDEKIIWANDSFTKISEYSLQEAIGHKPGQLLGGQEKDVTEVDKIRDAVSKGVPVRGEILNYTKSGKKYWSNYNIHPVRDEKGNLLKFFSIQSDITELKNIQEEIVAQRLLHQRKIALATLAAQEEKQSEIGRELHDNINQVLAVAKLYLNPVLKAKGDNKKNAELVNENIQLAIDEIRKLSHRLVAPPFKEKNIREIFEMLVKNMQGAAITRLNISKLKEENFTNDMKLALYRIAQEQFTNINKHSKASNVNLHLSGDGNQVKMIIEDDGTGFDMAQVKNGIGINNIYNRAESVNGRAEIISAPGKGCKLNVTIPVQLIRQIRTFGNRI